MKFEIGKFYIHTSGKCLAILGELETTMWGKALIAEESSPIRNPGLIAVGRDEGATINYVEISEEEWMKNFS